MPSCRRSPLSYAHAYNPAPLSRHGGEEEGNRIGSTVDDQGNEVFSEYDMMSGIVYPHDQPYGPVLPDRTCPTIHGVKQYPVIHPTDTEVRVCMPFSPCPAAPAKGNVTLDGSLCLILCGKDADCQPGAFCYFTGVAHVCAFNYTVG
ncbi:hypothetical protein FOZ61_008838 [Perkinsus olseni]|uniref:Uncharacterized protein n=1 Tax=Perkinsus olseni TaxID=32597 RepID=A0A7J6M6F5_PEROL|nr:hypothetical protein FOZ61_008838 [Perkinsus olseni]